ncbi:FIG00652311: hypothetical protein [hydrothermal vent metagenome]|uniref:Uncharacterized protein n=1 Tax=hydrothermal vent metagenome TaxID=652676 RepID=A0A3B0TYS2_9ZZZZ
MNKTTTLSIAMALLLVNGIFANDPKTEIENLDINSIQYIEEEEEFDLGFDTADYLPENFDPYKFYVNLDAVVYIEDNEIDTFDSAKFLPEGFDAYADPTDVQSINYIDERDNIVLNFDAKKHLPEGFNAYIVKN